MDPFRHVPPLVRRCTMRLDVGGRSGGPRSDVTRRGPRVAVDPRERWPPMTPVFLLGGVFVLALLLSAAHAVRGAWDIR